VEWRGRQLVAVEGYLEGVISLGGESKRSSVCSIVVVTGLNLNTTLVGHHDEVISSKILVASVFIAGLDRESEVGESSCGVISSRSAVEMEGGIFDGLVLKSDLDFNRASFLSGISDGVGSISVVNNMRLNFLVGAVDLHNERITTVISGVSVIVKGMDGESGWLVVPQLLDSLTLGIRFVWIDVPFDVWVERSIFDWLVVERDVDGVVSGRFDLVSDRVGSVVVVVEIGSNGLRSSDGNLERISSRLDWVSVRINGVDGEGARLLGLSCDQSRSFSPRFARVGVFHQWVIRTSFDVLVVEEDFDSVSSGLSWCVDRVISSGMVVLELADQRGSVGSRDLH